MKSSLNNHILTNWGLEVNVVSSTLSALTFPVFSLVANLGWELRSMLQIRSYVKLNS